MDNKKALDKVVEAIKNSNNVLVTINRNPDVDQIAAAIALSFVLEKLEKFTTTIFSGPIPAAAKFLDPEKTFSSDMETLRDFVVSIHKDKVDRLRYKQEGDQVRVYLTPYRTTISQEDLEFENGNYNIDLVIVIGAVTQEDMDNAIIGAIRILHDATVVSINTGGTVPSYASIGWADQEEIAYCEMVADLAEILGEKEIDEHTATALLTGIVSATDQFKNIKANPKVMQLAAKLMSFGANQQLISIKLEEGMKIDLQQQGLPPPQQGPQPGAQQGAQPEMNQGQNPQPEQNQNSNQPDLGQGQDQGQNQQPDQMQNSEQIQHQDQDQTPAQDMFDIQNQTYQDISRGVETTTSAVHNANNNLAINKAENDYQQLSGQLDVHGEGAPPEVQQPEQPPQFEQQSPMMQPPMDAPMPGGEMPAPVMPPQPQPEQQPEFQPPQPEQQFQPPPMAPPVSANAPWPPKMEDMQHGRDYADYYNATPAPVPPPIPAQPEQLPVQPPMDAPVFGVDSPASAPPPDMSIPSMVEASMPPMPAPDINVGGIPMPPMPPTITPDSTGSVMNDLASYAPPEIQAPNLPQTEPSQGFFAPPATPTEAPAPVAVPQDITSRNFMSADPNLDNPGGIMPIEGDQQLSAETAAEVGPIPELADLGNIAAQASTEELSSDSGRASFNVSEELGDSQSANPFLMQNTPGPEVNDPLAQLQQSDAQAPPAEEIPNNQFKIPGQ
ncbi:hypothetical protein FWF93_03415 [Candidatus Saccharibacteria bacterium]|nr:hypothetical protein [Candidatus Saccharibacteria bacterium]